MLMQFLLASWCRWIFQMMKLSGKKSQICAEAPLHIIINIRRNNFTTETLEHVVLNNDKPRLSFSTYSLYNFLDFFHLLIAILKLEPQTWLHAVAGYLLPKRSVSKEWVRVSANIIITSFMAFSANSFRNSFTY